MLLTRDSFSFRSGEWTHTDWLCHCVKGYPVSCRLTLPLPPDSRSRKSWISHLCLTLCLCVWIQETSDSLKSLDSITRTNNILTFLWSLWVMTWSEGIWRWISFFYLTYFIFAFLFLFLRGERTSLSPTPPHWKSMRLRAVWLCLCNYPIYSLISQLNVFSKTCQNL